MLATFDRAQTAMVADSCRSQRMPFSMPAMGMCMSASAAASTIIIGTGVITPVSLFGLLVVSLILVSLVVIISLLLTCLTRLVRLESLVGQVTLIATRTTRGV